MTPQWVIIQTLYNSGGLNLVGYAQHAVNVENPERWQHKYVQYIQSCYWGQFWVAATIQSSKCSIINGNTCDVDWCNLILLWLYEMSEHPLLDHSQNDRGVFGFVDWELLMLRGSVVFCYSVYDLHIFIMGFATYMTCYVMWVKWGFTVIAGWCVPIEW